MTTVVEPDRSCVVSVTSSPLHIAAAAAAAAGVDSWSTQSNIGCGTKTQPWMLEAPAGQLQQLGRHNISLALHHASSPAAAAAVVVVVWMRIISTATSSTSHQWTRRTCLCVTLVPTDRRTSTCHHQTLYNSFWQPKKISWSKLKVSLIVWFNDLFM